VSAQVEEHGVADHRGGTDGQLLLAPDAVEVRRNGGLMALVGAVAAAVAIAWLARASGSGAVVDWALTAVMATIAVGHLAAFVDSRTPLLVADVQGVRVRLGRTWRGLPWGALRSIEHTPRRSWLRDGRLVVVPHTTEKLLGELDARGRRQASLATRMYGAPLALPLGLTTRASQPDAELAAALRELAGPGVEVVTVVASEPVLDDGDVEDVEDVEDVGDVEDVDPPAVPSDVEQEPAPGPAPEAPAGPPAAQGHDPRPGLARLLGAAAALGHRRRRDTGAAPDEAAPGDGVVDDGLPGEVGPEPADAAASDPVEADPVEATPVDEAASETPEPARASRLVRRSEVTVTASREEPDLDDTQPVGRELRRPGSVSLVEDREGWGERVHPIARAGSPVAPLVVDDFVAEPASDPVIGPELAAARTRLGLSVDALAERTRVRPHVIESMEVDDFAPCGGDFYARGHLRTLARVLGLDVTPLLAQYDERYAHAPISPRRVFEAELATGTHGGIRGTRGGPNWSVLVAAVMAVVLAWSVARLLTDGPEPVQVVPALSNGSGGVNGGAAAGAEAMPVLLRAASGGAHVVVRDGDGKTVFTGDLTYGATRSLDVVPPVRVESSDGGVEVVADGVEEGQLGEPGQPATGTFVAR
jgi:hypothetical protein